MNTAKIIGFASEKISKGLTKSLSSMASNPPGGVTDLYELNKLNKIVKNTDSSKLLQALKAKFLPQITFGTTNSTLNFYGTKMADTWTPEIAPEGMKPFARIASSMDVMVKSTDPLRRGEATEKIATNIFSNSAAQKSSEKVLQQLKAAFPNATVEKLNPDSIAAIKTLS